MEKEVLNIEICNTADQKQVVELFSLASLDQGSTPQPDEIVPGDGSGELYSFSNKSNTPGSYLDTVNNILYIPTSAGIYIYDIFTKSESYINTSTSVQGQSLPSNDVEYIFVDENTNTLYAASGKYGWVYDIDNNSAYQFAETNNANLTFIIYYDDIIYFGANPIDHMSKRENGVNTNITVPANGDDVSYGTITDIIIHESTNTLYCATAANGLYSYNIDTDTGKHFTTGTSVNGTALPSNDTQYAIAINEDIILVPTDSGLWLYNITTDTGSVINTGTSVNGDSLPSNLIYDIDYDITDEKIYFSLGTAGAWRYHFATNTGEIIGTATSGDNRPGGTTSTQIVTYGSVLEIFNDELWRWNEYIVQQGTSGSTINISSSESNGVSYDYITRGIQQSPIQISKIIFTSENSLQKYNSLTHLIETARGSEETYEVQFSNYVNPLLPFKQIHVDLEENLLIDFEKFLKIPIEANTCVQLLFQFTQKSPDQLMKHLVPDNKDVLPIYYDEDGKQIPAISSGNIGEFVDSTVTDSTVTERSRSEVEVPQFKWLPPWIGIAIFAVLLKIKQKNG